MPSEVAKSNASFLSCVRRMVSSKNNAKSKDTDKKSAAPSKARRGSPTSSVTHFAGSDGGCSDTSSAGGSGGSSPVVQNQHDVRARRASAASVLCPAECEALAAAAARPMLAPEIPGVAVNELPRQHAPVVVHGNVGAESSGCTFALAITQGRRDYNEDRGAYRRIEMPDGRVGFLFCIFDGHGGDKAVEFAREALGNNLQQKLRMGGTTEAALRGAFALTDLQWLARGAATGDDSGTTALCALLVGKELFVANAGDGAAVLHSLSGAEPRQLSTTHSPECPEERKRIAQLGGSVEAGPGSVSKCLRVNGVLAVSRGFGDRSLKPFISSVPAVHRHVIAAGDAFLVMASDGLDVLTNEQVGSALKLSGNVEEAAVVLTDMAMIENAYDNISCAVISLAGLVGASESG